MKLSIITINRNNAEGLRKTMESVFAQTCRDFEYIVIDGVSSDDSVNVIKELESDGVKELGTFKWISEPDAGIYNAMNKGIEIAEGKRVVNSFNRSELIEDKNKEWPEYILMLNSGDFLLDKHVIERIMPELDGTDIVQGNNIEVRDGEICRNRGYGTSDIDILDVMKGHFLHQASFCRKDLFDRYGYFDESYKMSADTKFFMLCLGRYDASFRYVDIDVTNYDLSGISADTSDKWRQCRREELTRIIEEVFSRRIYRLLLENDKKIRLYDDLHAHKWTWYIIMLIARISACLYKR